MSRTLSRSSWSLHEVLADVPDDYEVLIMQGDRETGFYLYPNMYRQRTIWTYGDSLERSILNGFSHAKGDRIVVMDADGSHPPEMVPEMWRLLGEYELVIGSRFMEGAVFEGSPMRRFMTFITKVSAWEAGSKLKDPMSGFFAIRRDVLKQCKFRPLTWKTALEIELRAKPSVKEIPIKFVERTAGKSKTNLKVGLKILWQLATEAL